MPLKTEREEIAILTARLASLERRVSQDHIGSVQYVQEVIQRVTELENK
jgi:hypothetical protein